VARDRDLLVNFERMRREMDELFGDVWGEGGLAVAHGPDRLLAPGRRLLLRRAAAGDRQGRAGRVSLDSIGLEVVGRELVISGERPGSGDRGPCYQQVEIEAGRFRRVMS
jgi:HSP20 family protein